MEKANTYVLKLETLTSEDVKRVGGKNASLGEMIGSLKKEGIQIPDGFATTAAAYRKFLDANDLEEKIEGVLKDLNTEKKSLEKAGKTIRRYFRNAAFPA